jgi:uncharacterized repeat protein (TIGR01451 family)
MRFVNHTALLTLSALLGAGALPAMGQTAAQADLQLGFSVVDGEVTTAPAAVAYGGTVSYTLTVTNAGPSRAPNVQIAATVPAGTKVDSATGCTLGADVDGNPVFPCTIGEIVDGDSVDVELTFAVPFPKPTPTTCTTPTLGAFAFTVASVASAGPPAVVAATDPNAANNTVNVAAGTTTIRPFADLAVALSVDPDSAQPGQTVTYRGNVTNNGPCDVTGVRVNLDPAGLLELQPAQQGSCPAQWGDPAAAPSQQRCTISLAKGASFPFQLTYRITKPSNGVIDTASPVGASLTAAPSGGVASWSDPVTKDNTTSAQVATRGDTNGCSTGGGSIGLLAGLALLALRRRRA